MRVNNQWLLITLNALAHSYNRKPNQNREDYAIRVNDAWCGNKAAAFCASWSIRFGGNPHLLNIISGRVKPSNGGSVC